MKRRLANVSTVSVSDLVVHVAKPVARGISYVLVILNTVAIRRSETCCALDLVYCCAQLRARYPDTPRHPGWRVLGTTPKCSRQGDTPVQSVRGKATRRLIR